VHVGLEGPIDDTDTAARVAGHAAALSADHRGRGQPSLAIQLSSNLGWSDPASALRREQSRGTALAQGVAPLEVQSAERIDL